MRLDFDTNIQGKKNNEDAKAKRAAYQEHQKLLNNVQSVRDSIDEAEKKYKHFILLRRRMEANIGKKGLLEEPLTIDELINRSTKELENFKSRVIEEKVDKSKYDQAIEDQLQKKILETKEWYAKRRSVIAGNLCI